MALVSNTDNVPLLEIEKVSKQFGAVEALHRIDLSIGRGEIVGICGDNGAGKSTLIRIIAGAETASSGTLRLGGQTLHFDSPGAALAQGIAAIYQHLALAPDLAVYQNIFMGAELLRPGLLPGLRVLDKTAMRRQAHGYLEQLDIKLPAVDVKVNTLSGGQRQAVAICRALRWQAQLVIMDEPTAALGVRETARVLELIRKLNDNGVSILLISHNMDDVVAVAQRVVILKNGRKVLEHPSAGLDADRLAHMVMTGHA